MVYITVKLTDALQVQSIDWTIADRQGKAMRRGKLAQVPLFGHLRAYQNAVLDVAEELQAQPWTDPIGAE